MDITLPEPDKKAGSRRGRPNYDAQFRLRLTLASLEPGMSVSKLARENGINANMLFYGSMLKGGATIMIDEKVGLTVRLRYRDARESENVRPK
jgi:hypothetical protein